MNLMMQWAQAAYLLLATTSVASGRPLDIVDCCWHPDDSYRDISLWCSGRHVTLPPLSDLPQLERLVMSDTGLESLDASTFQDRHLPHLTSLYVTNGILEIVERDAVASLPQLAKLDLSKNNLKYVDAGSFKSNKKLHSLDLSNNPSLEKPPNLTSDSLEKLNLEYCNLRNAEVGAFNGVTNLKIVYLDGNPNLDCTLIKTTFLEARPSLSVICENDVEQTSYSGLQTEKPEVSSAFTLQVFIVLAIVVIVVVAACICVYVIVVLRKRFKYSTKYPYFKVRSLQGKINTNDCSPSN